MRMNERGLGTGALVGIIVGVIVAVVVPVTVVAVVLGVGGGSPGGLPVYAGASYLTSSSQGNTTGCTYDLGTANLVSVYNWYKTEMPSQGWTLAGDQQITGGYYLLYTKGNDSAAIVIGEGIVEGYTTNSIKYLNLSYTPGTPTGGDGGVPC